MASFLANSSSSFPAIYTFGIFAAFLVFVNYCSVCVFYPCVVAWYDAKWRHSCKGAFCFGACRNVKKVLVGAVEKVRTPRGRTDEAAEQTPGEEGEKIGTIEKWFRDTYSVFLIKARFPILLCFAALLVTVIVFSAKIGPDPDPPQMFPDGDNFVEFKPTKGRVFSRGPSVYSIKARIVNGLDVSSPIDRGGTRETDADDIGDPNWAKYFEEDPIHWTESSDCFVHFCEQLGMKNDRIATGGGADFPVTCWLLDLKRDAQQAGWGWDMGNRTWLATYVLPWMVAPENYKRFQPLVHAEDSDLPNVPARLRFYWAEVKLTKEIKVEYTDGIDLYEEWDKWVDEQFQCTNCPCAGKKDIAPVFQSMSGGAFFYVQEKLIEEAFTGIGISLVLAFVVLTVATMNVVISFVATITIGAIVASVIAFAVFNGWKLGVLESVNFVLVPGMAVDFVAHLAEAYAHSHAPTRQGRMREMLAQVGISVISGAFSTLGACFFLFFAFIIFFVKFGAFIFATIAFSLVWSLGFFATVLGTFGPQGDNPMGDLRRYVCKKKAEEANQPQQPDTAHTAPSTAPHTTPAEPPRVPVSGAAAPPSTAVPMSTLAPTLPPQTHIAPMATPSFNAAPVSAGTAGPSFVAPPGLSSAQPESFVAPPSAFPLAASQAAPQQLYTPQLYPPSPAPAPPLYQPSPAQAAPAPPFYQPSPAAAPPLYQAPPAQAAPAPFYQPNPQAAYIGQVAAT